MSGSPKYTPVDYSPMRAQQVAAERARRERERREREQQAREAALKAARQKAEARIAQVRRRINALRGEIQAAAPEFAQQLASIEQTVGTTEAQVRQAPAPEAIPAIIARIDNVERSAVALRSTVVAKHQLVVANRLSALIDLVEEVPRAERLAVDRAGVSAVDGLIAAAQRLTMTNSVGPVTEIDRLGEAVRSHLDRVLAHRAEQEEARRTAEEQLSTVNDRLALLRAEAASSGVEPADDKIAMDLSAAAAAYGAGRYDFVTAAVSGLLDAITRAEAQLDSEVEGIAARRDMLAAIVNALPGLGFDIDGSSVAESPDRTTIGLRAHRADGEQLAVVVRPGEGAPAQVLYATASMEHDREAGVDRGACDPLIDVINELGEQLRAEGFEPGEINWDGNALRPPPYSAVHRGRGSGSQARSVGR